MQKLFESLRTELVVRFPERQSVIDGSFSSRTAATTATTSSPTTY